MPALFSTAMVRITQFVRAASLAIALVVVLAGSVSRAAELPPNVREALEQNAAAVMPLEVHWTMQRTSPLPLPELLKFLEEPNAIKLLVSNEYRFAMQDHKFHYWDQCKGCLGSQFKWNRGG